jgi:aminopeptidase N
MTTYYSQNYCEHPFQKNGFATLNSDFIWGGMENQTLTSRCPGCWYESIISHEFAHQWYGDMITCGTWADIWLNEGFATWSEAFWIEKNQGYSGYLNTIHSDASGYISNNPGWAIVVPDWAINTPPVNILFNFEITYEKAACALHQIRYMLGDSLFFLTLQTYCADTNLKFKSSTTPDFNAEVNAVTGLNYDWYFTDWLYQPNHPVYQNQYNIDSIGNGLWNVNFMASQIQTDPAFFRMLLNVKIWFEDSSDTIIRFMNDYDNQTYTWTFNKRPVMFKFDPDDQIVLKEGSTVLGIPEQVKMQGFQLFQNIPNPAGANTKIVFELKNDTQVRIDITDISGKLITRPVDEYATAGKHSIDVNCTSFAPGVYYYTMKAGGFSQTRKMVIVQ